MLQHARYQHGLQLILSRLNDGVVDVDTLVREEGPVVGQVVVLQSKVSHCRAQTVVVQLVGWVVNLRLHIS